MAMLNAQRSRSTALLCGSVTVVAGVLGFVAPVAYSAYQSGSPLTNETENQISGTGPLAQNDGRLSLSALSTTTSITTLGLDIIEQTATGTFRKFEEHVRSEISKHAAAAREGTDDGAQAHMAANVAMETNDVNRPATLEDLKYLHVETGWALPSSETETETNNIEAIAATGPSGPSEASDGVVVVAVGPESALDVETDESNQNPSDKSQIAVEVTKSVAHTSPETWAELKVLAELQRDQIASQERSLETVAPGRPTNSGNNQLPSNAADLARLIEFQQSIIESHNQQLKLQTRPTATSTVADGSYLLPPASDSYTKADMVTRSPRDLNGARPSEPITSHNLQLAGDVPTPAPRPDIASNVPQRSPLPSAVSEQRRAARQVANHALPEITDDTESAPAHGNAIADKRLASELPALQPREPYEVEPELIVAAANFAAVSPQPADPATKLGTRLPSTEPFRPTTDPELATRSESGVLAHELGQPNKLADDVLPIENLSTNSQPVDQLEYEVPNDKVHYHSAPAAQGPSVTHVAAMHGYDVISDPELDEIRAGFVTPSGIEFNIGFDFRTHVDGTLVAHNNFTFDGSESSVPGSVISVLQGANGRHTTVVNTVERSGLKTLLHNTQDGVSIVHTTEFTVNILSVELLETMRSELRIGAGPGLANIVKDALISPVAIR